MTKVETRYRDFKELNTDTPSTGTICCYNGVLTDLKDKDDPDWEDQFIELRDCRGSVRLYRADYDTLYDWLQKVSKIKESIDNYYNYIKNRYEVENKNIKI